MLADEKTSDSLSVDTSERKRAKKRTSTYQYAKDNGHLLRLQELTGSTPQQLADAFGISPQHMRAMLSGKNKCPKWTLLAAEGITRRYNKRGAHTMAIIKVPFDKLTTVEAVVNSLGGLVQTLEI